MIRTPLVTVVMTTYNSTRFLEQCCRSLLSQSYPFWNMVCLDDGSTDGSAEVVESLLGERATVLRRDHRGANAPRFNEGIRLADGEFIARQDSDDWSERMRLETQVRFLLNRPEVAIVGTFSRVVGADGTGGGYSEKPTDPDGCRGFFGANGINPFIHGSVMFRREPFLAAGGYCENGRYILIEDLATWWRMLRGRGLAGANIPERLYVYRTHPGQGQRGDGAVIPKDDGRIYRSIENFWADAQAGVPI